MAFERSLFRFRKNDTVIGMIGHTQGVSKAKKPPNSPAKKIAASPQPSPRGEGVLSNACNSLVTGCQRSVRSGELDMVSVVAVSLGTSVVPLSKGEGLGVRGWGSFLPF